MKKGVCFCLVVLAAGISIAAGIGSSGFKNWHVNEWFNYWGKGAKTEQTEETEKSDQTEQTESHTGTVILNDFGEGNLVYYET